MNPIVESLLIIVIVGLASLSLVRRLLAFRSGKAGGSASCGHCEQNTANRSCRATVATKSCIETPIIRQDRRIGPN